MVGLHWLTSCGIVRPPVSSLVLPFSNNLVFRSSLIHRGNCGGVGSRGTSGLGSSYGSGLISWENKRRYNSRINEPPNWPTRSESSYYSILRSTYRDDADTAGSQPERVGEIDRIAAIEPIDIEPAGEPQGVFLGEMIPSDAIRTSRARKALMVFSLGAPRVRQSS